MYNMLGIEYEVEKMYQNSKIGGFEMQPLQLEVMIANDISL